MAAKNEIVQNLRGAGCGRRNIEGIWTRGQNMNRAVLFLLVLLLSLTACGISRTGPEAASQMDSEKANETASANDTIDTTDVTENAGSTADTAPAEKGENQMEEKGLKMMIGSTAVEVDWEENESVDALKMLVKDGPLTVEMSMYGGFEQVGSLGESLPRADVQTTTRAGDIVLYAGDQIVVFYGSNSWAYTRLGHIADKTAAEMAELLGNGDVAITLSAE